MSEQANRQARILKAMASYEANNKAKRTKRKSIKLFSLDEPQAELPMKEPLSILGRVLSRHQEKKGSGASAKARERVYQQTGGGTR